MSQEKAQQITIGVVGLGRAGWDIHLAALHPHSQFKVTGLVDPEAERRSEAGIKFGAKAYASLDDLLASDKPDVVVVASPSNFHYTEAKSVLNAGCHCVLEKPMAANAMEAEDLFNLADRQKKHLLVHHQMVFNPIMTHLRQVIERGLLGPVFSIRVFSGLYARRWDWQTLRKSGGGQLPNKCSHILSVVLPLMGAMPEVLAAELRNIKDAGDAEDHVELFLRSSTGMTANLVVSSAIALPGPEWVLLGKYGSLTCEGETMKVRFYDPTQVPDLKVIDAAAPGRQYLREDLPWQTEEWAVVRDPEAECFYDNVADVLLNHAEPRFSRQNALDLMRVMDRARELASEVS